MKSGEYEEVKSGSSLLQSAKQSECANFRIETQMRLKRAALIKIIYSNRRVIRSSIVK